MADARWVMTTLSSYLSRNDDDLLPLVFYASNLLVAAAGPQAWSRRSLPGGLGIWNYDSSAAIVYYDTPFG